MARRVHLMDSAQQIITDAQSKQLYTGNQQITGFMSSGGAFNDRWYNCAETDTMQQVILAGAAAGDEIYFAANWKTDNNFGGLGRWFLALHDTGNVNHIGISFNAGQKIEVTRNSISLGAPGSVVALDTFYGIEFRMKIADSPNGYVHCYLDGNDTPDFSITGADTRNANSDVPGFLYYGSNSASADSGFSHVVVISDSSPITPWHNPRLQDIMFNSDSTPNDFTALLGGSKFSEIDETPGDDAGATRIYSNTVGHRQLMGNAGLAIVPATIHCLVLNTLGFKTGGGARTLRGTIKSGSTDANGASKVLGNTTRHWQDPWELDPATSAAWTSSAVNALLGGPEIVA